MESRSTIRRVGAPGDLGWIIEAHGEFYAAEFGWDTTFEATVAGIVAEWANRGDREHEAGWIAEQDGRRVGCVLCVRDSTDTARLRILLVDPSVRGQGLGHALVQAVLDFARASSYRRVVLWTNHPLVAAARLYDELGFKLMSEHHHHSFGVDLIGQTYEMYL